MKKLICMAGACLLVACSPPKPPQPSGDWMPVNHREAAAQALRTPANMPASAPEAASAPTVPLPEHTGGECVGIPACQIRTDAKE